MEEFNVIVPAFTDFEHWDYLDNTLEDIRKSDVILMELYHEFKDLTLDYFEDNYPPSEYRQLVNKQLGIIHPELIKREPNHTISKTHGYIIDRLVGKEFLAFETLEPYDYFKKTNNQRNITLFKNIGELIEDYYEKTNRIVLLMSTAHTRPIRYYLNSQEQLDLNDYSKIKLRITKLIKEKKYNYSFVMSAHNRP